MSGLREQTCGAGEADSASAASLARELASLRAERDQARDALRELQAQYLSLVDQMPAGLFRKNAEGRYVFVNSWFCRLKGLKPEELLNKTPAELARYEASLGPGAEHELQARLAAAGADHHESIMRSGKTIEVDEEYCRADGKPIYLRVVKTPVFDPDGKTIGSQGILFDITEQQKAQAELDRQRHLLRSLLESSPDNIYFKDRQSRFLLCSKNMAKLFRVETPEQMIGKSDFDFFTPEHSRPAYDDEQRIMRTGETLIKTEKETWPDGRVTWVLTSKMPLRDSSGEVIGTFGISKDVTPIKEAEGKLEALHRQLMDASRQAGMAEVATSVLHNVGNVLNSVNVSVALLQSAVSHSRIDFVAKAAGLLTEHSGDIGEFLTKDPRGRNLPGYLQELGRALLEEKTELQTELDSLVANIEHIKGIVAMQQSLAKPGGVLEPADAQELLESALQLNRVSLERHKIEVVREYEPAPQLLVDRNKVLQILANLVKNAKEALEGNGRDTRVIRLKLRSDSRAVRISVLDNGVGIAPENLTRIFGHGFTTRKDGHGFGLHSSALAAKELGGSLLVESDGVGKGATFTLQLPVLQNKTGA